MRKFFSIIIAFLAIILVSCENKGSSTAPSSVAKLTYFSFDSDDKYPGLGKAVWTIEERIDTGLVWNKDSMLFGTCLDSVSPNFRFAATPAAAVIVTPDTTVRYTGLDTLSFSKGPIYLTIRSGDNKNTKVYEIRPTVHQVDPDLYVWEQLNEGIYPEDDSEQKVVEMNEQFYMITSNGFELHAFRSPDGEKWTDLGEPTGLPLGTRVRQIVSDNSTLYYGLGNYVYTSEDAVHWTEHPVKRPVVTMLLYWEDLVWALTESEIGFYELAWFKGDTLDMTGIYPMSDFPVSDFGTVTFTSASGRNRATIIGGFAQNGKSLSTRWNLEYAKYMPSGEGTFRVEEFSIGRPESMSLTGISIVWYNNQLMLFGGVDDKMSYLGRNIYVSNNEGMTWQLADTVKNQLPLIYQARQKQNAIVRDEYIYLFGGQDAKTTYSDVYRGKLNSIGW